MKTLLTAFAIFLAFCPVSLWAQKPKVVWSDKTFEGTRYKINEVLGNYNGITYMLRVADDKKANSFLLEKYDSASFKFLGITEISHSNLAKKDYSILKYNIYKGQCLIYENYYGATRDSVLVDKLSIDLSTGKISSVMPVLRKKTAVGFDRTVRVYPSKDAKLLSIVVELKAKDSFSRFADLYVHVLDMEANKIVVDFKNYMSADSKPFVRPIEYETDEMGNVAILCIGTFNVADDKASFLVFYINALSGSLDKYKVSPIEGIISLDAIFFRFKEGRFYIRYPYKVNEEKNEIYAGFRAAEFDPQQRKIENVINIIPQKLYDEIEVAKNGSKKYSPSYVKLKCDWPLVTLGTNNEVVIVQGYKLESVGNATEMHSVPVRSNIFAACYYNSGKIVYEKSIKAPAAYIPNMTDVVCIANDYENLYFIWADIRENIVDDAKHTVSHDIMRVYEFVLLSATLGKNDSFKKSVIEDYTNTREITYPAAGSNQYYSTDLHKGRIFLTKVNPAQKTFKQGYLILDN